MSAATEHAARYRVGGRFMRAAARQAGAIRVFGQDGDASFVYVFSDGSALGFVGNACDFVVSYKGGWASADANGNPDPTRWVFGLAEDVG